MLLSAADTADSPDEPPTSPEADTTDDLDELLAPPEVARLTTLSVSTLKDRRWKGTGPPFVKLSPGRGGRIRYRRGAVLAWIADRENA